MLTIAPPASRAKAARAKAWERKKTALRLTSITASQSASVKSTASARRMMPALLTRMSRGPSVGERRAAAAGVVEGERRAAAPSGPRPAMQAEGLVERRAAGGDHLGAGAGQAEGDRLADAGVGAGDERGACRRGGRGRSPQVLHRHHVHVLVVDVVAGHRPDEGIGRGAGAGVDRPGRRDRALLVGAGRGGGSRSARPSGGGRGRSRARSM